VKNSVGGGGILNDAIFRALQKLPDHRRREALFDAVPRRIVLECGNRNCLPLGWQRT